MGCGAQFPLGDWSFLKRTGFRVLLCSTLKLMESVALSGRGLLVVTPVARSPPICGLNIVHPSHPIFSFPVAPGQERLGGGPRLQGSGQEPQGQLNWYLKPGWCEAASGFFFGG